MGLRVRSSNTSIVRSRYSPAVAMMNDSGFFFIVRFGLLSPCTVRVLVQVMNDWEGLMGEAAGQKGCRDGFIS